jgi:hypothetical protein
MLVVKRSGYILWRVTRGFEGNSGLGRRLHKRIAERWRQHTKQVAQTLDVLHPITKSEGNLYVSGKTSDTYYGEHYMRLGKEFRLGRRSHKRIQPRGGAHTKASGADVDVLQILHNPRNLYVSGKRLDTLWRVITWFTEF